MDGWIVWTSGRTTQRRRSHPTGEFGDSDSGGGGECVNVSNEHTYDMLDTDTDSDSTLNSC
jgi:hypothetical protein